MNETKPTITPSLFSPQRSSARVRACVRACMHACMQGCVCAPPCASVRPRPRACMHVHCPRAPNHSKPLARTHARGACSETRRARLIPATQGQPPPGPVGPTPTPRRTAQHAPPLAARASVHSRGAALLCSARAAVSRTRKRARRNAASRGRALGRAWRPSQQRHIAQGRAGVRAEAFCARSRARDRAGRRTRMTRCRLPSSDARAQACAHRRTDTHIQRSTRRGCCGHAMAHVAHAQRSPRRRADLLAPGSRGGGVKKFC